MEVYVNLLELNLLIFMLLELQVNIIILFRIIIILLFLMVLRLSLGELLGFFAHVVLSITLFRAGFCY
jgi:hypothetical protein